MTKKDFLQMIKGKKVIIENKEDVIKWATDGSFNSPYFERMLKIHEKGLKTVVKSKDIVINNCCYAIKNIEILTEKTFKSKYQAEKGLDIIYRIVD